MTNRDLRNKIAIEKIVFLMGWYMRSQSTKLKYLLLALASLVLFGCATRESASHKEANRVIAMRTQMYQTYDYCRKSIRDDSDFADFWTRTAFSLKDPRRLELLTLNKPITKAYRDKAMSVAKQLTYCDAVTLDKAKLVTSSYAKSFGASTSYVTAVYVDVIQGKFKSYGEMNKAMFAAMEQAQGVMQSANDKLADDFLANSRAEMAIEQQNRAAAMMIMGAGMQNAAAASQNSYNNVRNAAPVTTNCRMIGGTMSCSSY